MTGSIKGLFSDENKSLNMKNIISHKSKISYFDKQIWKFDIFDKRVCHVMSCTASHYVANYSEQ